MSHRRRRLLLRRIVRAIQGVKGVGAMMGGRGWVGRGMEGGGGGGGVLVMGRAMSDVSMDMAMGETGQKGRGMHMRRCLGGKDPVVAAAGSEKGRRRREQGEGMVWNVQDGVIMGMI